MESSYAAGARGEDLAAQYLRRKGYRIRERNFRCRQGEIDMIAEKAGILVFVEVKLRKSTAKGQPREAVDWRKQQRILGAAQYYLYSKKINDVPMRFDVIEIYDEARGLRINQIENAFWS